MAGKAVYLGFHNSAAHRHRSAVSSAKLARATASRATLEDLVMKKHTIISPITLVVTGMILAAARAGASPSITAVTPIFGQVIAVSYPSQFRVANEETKGNYYLQESVKASETVDQWSEMITLTGRQGAASLPQASGKGFVLPILRDFQTACPATFSILELGPRNLDGREGFAAIGSCGNVSTAEEASKNAAHSETPPIVRSPWTPVSGPIVSSNWSPFTSASMAQTKFRVARHASDATNTTCSVPSARSEEHTSELQSL